MLYLVRSFMLLYRTACSSTAPACGRCGYMHEDTWHWLTECGTCMQGYVTANSAPGAGTEGKGKPGAAQNAAAPKDEHHKVDTGACQCSTVPAGLFYLTSNK